MSRHAVVTGGAGFLGSHLCDSLLAAGWIVTCLDNYSTSLPANVAHLTTDKRFRLAECDVINGIPELGDVHAVIHLASAASPRDYAAMAVETLKAGSIGTLNALDFARRCGARFLLASTSEVYGDPLVSPQPETYWGNVNPVGPRSMYDEAKRFSEALTVAYLSAGTDVAIVRLFNGYGPRMRLSDGRVIPALIGQALAGTPLTVTGDGSQTRSFCYADDLVQGIMRMLDSDLAGPVNIGNADERTILEVAKRIVELADSSSEVTLVERPGGDPRVRRPDVTLAREALGWTAAVSLDDGLARTIAWYRRQIALAAS
jgi:dTDP-glucose 4,6-dehydratase